MVLYYEIKIMEQKIEIKITYSNNMHFLWIFLEKRLVV